MFVKICVEIAGTRISSSSANSCFSFWIQNSRNGCDDKWAIWDIVSQSLILFYRIRGPRKGQRQIWYHYCFVDNVMIFVNYVFGGPRTAD